MSDPRQQPAHDSEEPQSQGPNLVVLYTIVAVALVTAIGLALLIVLPFYNHRH
jgi:hypothetical protein